MDCNEIRAHQALACCMLCRQTVLAGPVAPRSKQVSLNIHTFSRIANIAALMSRSEGDHMDFSRGWPKSVRLVATLLSCLIVSEGVASAQAPTARLQIQLPPAQPQRPNTIDIARRNMLQTEAVNPPPQQAGRRFGKATIITILAAAAIVGVAVANRDGSNGATPNAVQGTTITPATVTVGTPR